MSLADACREFVRMRDELERIDALLPDCPTCGGTGEAKTFIAELGRSIWQPCPAGCVDGKVTVAQMVALWQAVHGLPQLEREDVSSVALLAYLRGVRP